MTKSLFVLSCVALAGLALASSAPPAAANMIGPPEISWEVVGTDMVHFQLHFVNPHPEEYTQEALGELYSQEFGVFLQHYGLIGTFDIPPIPPESFFDVFFDVPLSSLPPSAGTSIWLGTAAAGQAPCPPLTWNGNVDVIWSGPGGAGQVNAHYGTVGVYPGAAQGCIHVLTGCGQMLTWGFRNVCPGWTATLVNEDFTPAPALLPPGWSGHVCVWANTTVPVGTTCCFNLDLTCGGATSTINVCAIACDPATPTTHDTWGRIKTLYR